MSEQDEKKGLGLTPSQVAAGALASVTAAVLGSFLGVAGTVIGAGLASIISTVGAALYQHSLDRTKRAVVRNTGALRVTPNAGRSAVRQHAAASRPSAANSPANRARSATGPNTPAAANRATAVGHYAPVQLDMDAAAIAKLATPRTEQQPGVGPAGQRPVGQRPVGQAPVDGRPMAGRNPMTERTHVIQRHQLSQRTQLIQPSGPRTRTEMPMGAEPTVDEPQRRWRPNWVRVAVISALVFVLGMLVLTGIEWAKGSAFGNGGGATTVGDVFHPQPAAPKTEKPATETQKPKATNEKPAQQEQQATTTAPETTQQTPAPETSAAPTQQPQQKQQNTPNPQPVVVPPTVAPTP